MAKQKQEVDLSHIPEDLRHLAVEISSLNPDPSNTVDHSDENIEAIAASFRKFGQDQLIVVQKTGRIVRKGNGRLEAAKKLGWTHIAALIIDEDDINAIERAIADNRTSELRTWNKPHLREAIEMLAGRGDGTIASWSADQIEAILGTKTGPAEFPEIGEDIDFEHECPKCHYKFSGGKKTAAPAEATEIVATGDGDLDERNDEPEGDGSEL